MPGRPRTMVKKVTELEDRAFALDEDLLDLIPAQYLKSDRKPNPLGKAWIDAACAAQDTCIELGGLVDLLREKAGLPPREYSEPDDEVDTTDAMEPSASVEPPVETSGALDGGGGDRGQDK